MGKKGDDVASLKKVTFWKLLIMIFNVVCELLKFWVYLLENLGRDLSY